MDEAHTATIERLRAGVAEPYTDRRPALRVVDVAGRRSGRSRPFPVNVTAIDGHLYACSATRERDWVHNLMAAGRCRIEQGGPGGSDVECSPVMVGPDEAVAVLAVYLPQAGFPDPRLPFDVDAPPERMRREAHRTAVVRFDPAG